MTRDSLFDDRFAELRKDVCDFPEGEISVPVDEIKALLAAYDLALVSGQKAFVKEVQRCRQIEMPLDCCDEWPECSHVLRWIETVDPAPDVHDDPSWGPESAERFGL